MQPLLTWTVEEQGGRIVVTLRGELALVDTALLRARLMKCLAEQPDAVLVDLSSMTVSDHTALAVFTVVVRQAELWPGTPVLLCAPIPDTARQLARGRFGRLPVYESLAEAAQAVDTGLATTLSIADELLPIAGATRHARDMATEACTRWNLPHLIGPASLVASELVSNAIAHAGTMMTFRITRRPRYVHLAVHDGSPEEPKLTPPADATVPGGRGLLLVASVAVRWGSLPSKDGKVVWATLAADP
jgi:anti-anti-sigma regulatory factor/anti-sigma regulatory factor (Ser/Thr protein kinase)